MKKADTASENEKLLDDKWHVIHFFTQSIIALQNSFFKEKFSFKLICIIFENYLFGNLKVFWIVEKYKSVYYCYNAPKTLNEHVVLPHFSSGLAEEKNDRQQLAFNYVFRKIGKY